MCSIAGVWSKAGSNVVPMLIAMLGTMTHRAPDGVGVYARGRLVRAKSLEGLATEGLVARLALGGGRLSIVGAKGPLQPLLGCEDDISLAFNGEIYNHAKIRQNLSGHRFEANLDSEVVVHLFEDLAKEHGFPEAARRLPSMLDGMYALALYYKGRLALLRDPLGIKPLYTGEDEGHWAFASERKGLWAIGIRAGVRPLLPGHLIVFEDGEASTFAARGIEVQATFKDQEPMLDVDQAAIRLLGLLRESVRKMASMDGRLGVLFSGGLDSTILAKVASEFIEGISLYCAAFPNMRDAVNAVDVAERLGLELRYHPLSLEELRAELPKILYAIEEPEPISLSIAIPIYFACRLAAQDGTRVLLSAQGADELFAGYRRYEEALRLGKKDLEAGLLNDVLNLWRLNLQRDDAASMAHGVEVRYPFLDLALVEFALSLPLGYKIRRLDDGSYERKRILRVVARALGLPDAIVSRPKIAAQYGSGASRALKLLARSVLTEGKLINKDLVRAYINRVAAELQIADRPPGRC